MTKNGGSASYSPNRIDTLIGAGMRIDGDIACTGVLRVQGNVLGNVSCQGALVVDSAGSVTGAIDAEHIVVRGRVTGPASSSRSIEVHQGGSLLGDVSFVEIAIHAGGVVEGSLAPSALPDANAVARKNAPQLSDAPAVDKRSAPLAGQFAERFGSARKIAAVITTLAIVAITAWVGRDRLTSAPPAEVVALTASSSPTTDAADPKPIRADGSESQTAQKAVAENSVLPANEGTTQTSPANGLEGVREEVVTVRGANPSRSAGVFLLVSHEAALLYRKQRDDTGNGTRIATSSGEKISVSISPDDLVRVAKGREIDIFFQGQKVPRHIINSGSWISFVPRSAVEKPAG